MKRSGRVFIRILCLALVMVLCLAGCEQKNKKKIKDSSDDDDDFLPVMAEVDGVSTTRSNGGTGKKRVAITFDDGPHNVRTKAIVDELAKYGYSATFFVIGNRVDGTAYNGAEAMIYAYQKGNEIAIHGYTHSVYYDNCEASVYSSELSRTEKAIKDKIKNANVRLMRPVGGRITAERVQQSKYSVIMWDVDSEDWKYKYKSGDTEADKQEKIEKIVNNVMMSVEDGSVILMHDIYESTYDAAVIILRRLHEEGYEVVTVSELFGSELRAGRKYVSNAA